MEWFRYRPGTCTGTVSVEKGYLKAMFALWLTDRLSLIKQWPRLSLNFPSVQIKLDSYFIKNFKLIETILNMNWVNDKLHSSESQN